MFSRLNLSKTLLSFAKKSLQPAPIIFKFQIPQTKTLIKSTKYNFSNEEYEYLQDYSDFTMAQGIMKAYVKNQENSPKDILQAFVGLERYKLGVISSEPIYRTFLGTVKKGLGQTFTSEELQVLVESAYNMHIKDVGFWELIYKNLEKSKDTIHLRALLAIYDTLLKVKQYPKFTELIAPEIAGLKPKILKYLDQFILNDCVRAIYIFGYFEQEFPELVNKLKTDLLNSALNIDMLLTADQLANAAMIVLNLPEDPNFDKGRIMRDISGHFISRDTLEYDLTLQHYEYDSPTPGESGVRDRLRWESIAKMARVYSSDEFYDDTMMSRLKETIFRKSETDLVDFENAAVILSVYARIRKMTWDNDFYSRILEMFHWQLNNEDNEVMLSQYDGKNISFFLDAVNIIANAELDPELLTETFNYFSGVIQGGQIDPKIKEHEWKALLEIFKDAKRYARFDPGVINYLQDKIELLSAN